jgi:predicted DNA-binding protein YlxM (UPF0122 family)
MSFIDKGKLYLEKISQGYTLKEITKEFKVSRCSIEYCIKIYSDPIFREQRQKHFTTRLEDIVLYDKFGKIVNKPKRIR